MVPPFVALFILFILSPLTALARSFSLGSRAPGTPAVALENNGTNGINAAGNDSDVEDGKAPSLRTLQSQCVDANLHPEWLSGGGRINPSACVAALASVQQTAGPDVRTPHIFYSLRVFPRWPPQPGAVGLPQGQTAPISRGNCVFVVRMKNDFARNVLPLASGGYLDPEDLPVQTRTWQEVFTTATRLLNDCVRSRGSARAGWSTVGQGQSMEYEGLVVSFWPRNSIIDLMYGANIDGVGGNDTVFELSPQPTS